MNMNKSDIRIVIELSIWLAIITIVSVLGIFVLCNSLMAQTTIILNENVTEISLPNGGRQQIIQQNQNYYDVSTGSYKKRDPKFDIDALPNKLSYRQGHNVLLDTLSGYINLNKGSRYITFKPVNPDLPNVAREKAKVNYRAFWQHVDYRVELLSDGNIETFITLLNSNASTSFSFAVEFSEMPIVSASGIQAGEASISIPRAVDATGTAVPVQWNLSAPVNGIYTYTMSINPAGFTYPIVIDPTLSINAAYYGFAYVSDGSLATGRQATSASVATGRVDIEISAGTNARWSRGVLKFPLTTLPPSSDSVTVVDSALVTMTGNNASSTTDFKFRGLWTSGQQGGAVQSNDYTKFVGWVSGSGAYTGIKNLFGAPGGSSTIWADSAWHSDLYSATGVNRFRAFTYAADTLVAHAGDTLRITFIMGQDSSGGIIASGNNQNYVQLKTSTPTPALLIYYHRTRNVKALYNISAISTTDSIGIVFTDTTSVTTYVKLLGGDFAVIDSVKIPSTTGTFSDTLWDRALTPNLKDTLYVSNVDSSTGDSIVSARQMKFTLAKRPLAPSFSNLTTTTFDLTINANNNSSLTHYAVWDSTWRRWVKANGDTTAQSDTTWTTKADWDGTTITRRSRFVAYSFYVYGRNGDSIKTVFSPVGVVASIIDSLQIFALDTNKLRLYADLDTFAIGDSIRFYVYKAGTSDTVWGNYKDYASTLVQDTITVTGGPNTRFMGGVRIVETGVLTHYYSPIDSARTLSVRITSASITWTSDTSFTLSITPNSSVPLNTGYFLIDSQKVRAGSDSIYLNADSTGWFKTKVISSYKKLQLPIKFTRTQRTVGDTLRLRILSTNTDSTGTGIP